MKQELIDVWTENRKAMILPNRDNQPTGKLPEVNTAGRVKRVFDILLCLPALPLLLPLFAIIALGLKTNSPGPVFYRGQRTGLGGKVFRIFKFRTMSIDAEKTGGGTTALNDPRIFPFGRFLRKHKLDEFPQIFNVLKGDMSLVGPRPELLQYTKQYQGEELLILAVRPGITDYGSIEFNSLDEIVGSGNADRVFEEKVLTKKNQLRVKYVKERTLTGDIVLILRTLALLFKKVLG